MASGDDGRMDDAGTLERATLTLAATIRRCREEDLPALEWHGLYTAHREIIRKAFAMQRHGDGCMLLADVNGFPAGQVWIDFVRRRPQGRATLWAVRVFPAFQRCGLGTRLMIAAESAIAARGVAEAELGVDRDNAAVVHFYERLGYVPCDTERGRFAYRAPDGRRIETLIDQWILRKTVAPAPPRHAVKRAG